ncbi:hypothetical protein ABEF95_015578 [Exophiala dermatitidis]
MLQETVRSEAASRPLAPRSELPQRPRPRDHRLRVSHACEGCRLKKVRCNGVRPACGRCSSLSLECQYGFARFARTKQLIKDLTTKVEQYESILTSAKDGVSEEIVDAPLVQPQPSETPSSNKSVSSDSPTYALAKDIGSNHSERATDSLRSTRSGSSSESSSATYSHELTTQSHSPQPKANPNTSTGPCDGCTSRKPLRDWATNHAQMVESLLKPPRHVLEKAVRCFLDGSAILFNYFSEEELSSLLDVAYSESSSAEQSISPTVALCQLSAVAATGCQYYPERFDDATRTAFLSIVKVTLDDCSEASGVAAVRVMALLCMYFTFEKRISALTYAETGLRIARAHGIVDDRSRISNSSPWKRIVSSLVFLDCWISATTGHMPEALSSGETQSPLLFELGTSGLTIDIVQNEMTKAAVLSALIMRDVHHAKCAIVTRETLAMYRSRLEEWLLNLPDFMKLAHLVDGVETDKNIRAVFLVHLLFMHTLMLLYRSELVALAHTSQAEAEAKAEKAFITAQEFLDPCLWSARQVGRILKIAQSQELILSKCWMFINTSYCTANVLLYFSANRLLYQQPNSGEIETTTTVEDDLAATAICIDVLEFCGRYDDVAKQYLATIAPLNNELQDIFRRLAAQNSSIPDESDAESLRRVISSSANYLIHPSPSSTSSGSTVGFLQGARFNFNSPIMK